MFDVAAAGFSVGVTVTVTILVVVIVITEGPQLAEVGETP